MGKKIKKAFKSVGKVVSSVVDPLGVVTGIGGRDEVEQDTVLAPQRQEAASPVVEAPKNAAATQAEIDAEIERKRRDKAAAKVETGSVNQPLGTKTVLGG
jgi:hypothetical protein